MNDLQNKLLGGYAAVRITNKEQFEQIIEWLAIKNCFLANKEPVSKMNYPGDAVFVLYRADDGFIWWAPVSDVDINKYQLVDVNQLELVNDKKIIEANATVINEVVEINEKALTLTTNDKPAGTMIDSNIKNLLKLIPAIEAKANVIVDENNYKTFVAKNTGTVPTLRKYAKNLKVKKGEIKSRYMESFENFEKDVDKVINALENTAKKIADNVDVFEQKRRDELRKEREGEINKLKAILIEKKMISKKYADKFVFEEKWLNVSCTKKKFQEEAENQFNSLIEKEKIDKQNLEMIERTIMNQCSLLQIDESTISRDKYVQMLNNGVGLGDVVSAITTEINAIKKNADAVLEYQKKRNQEQLESQKKEATLQHQKEIEAIKKQQAQNINSEDEYENFYRGDEIIAKANDKYVVTEIKGTPEKYLGKKWTKTFEFTGDLASLQMLNRYMDFLKQTKEFDFKQVDIITKLLADPNTGAVGKYNVKEVN